MNQLKINFDALDVQQRVINLNEDWTIEKVVSWFKEMQTNSCNQAEMYDYLCGPEAETELAKDGVYYDTLWISGTEDVSMTLEIDGHETEV